MRARLLTVGDGAASIDDEVTCQSLGAAHDASSNTGELPPAMLRSWSR
jgi:hypothetical protein